MTNKLPITIGIVGHMDAIITDQHKKSIKNIFNVVSENYPQSPITLFSQLAIGADSEVAKLFFEIKEQTNRDYRLIVPIPYDLAYYKKKQFKTEIELDTFNGLLEKSERYFILNRLSHESKKELNANININLDELNEYYRKGGEFVADSSILLILLWDGFDNMLEGSSSNIFNYKITGSYQKHISDNMFDAQGSLMNIPCNRKGDDKPIILADNYFNIIIEETSIKDSLDKIEDLNLSGLKTEQRALNKSAEYLFPKEKDLNKNNQNLKDFYALIDTQAIKHQKNYHIVLKGLFLLGLIIFGVFESYKHLGLIDILFFSTITLIALAFGVFKISFKWQNHKKYIENRVLAESLRIQFYWNLKKLRFPVSKYILRIHKAEYNWLKHILLAIYGLTYPDDNAKAESISVIKEFWIDDQKKYFTGKVAELDKLEIQFKFISYVVFIIGLILLVGIFIINLKYEQNKILDPLIVLDSILFGLFALIKAYYEKRGYKQTRTQNSLMSSIYTASSEKIKEIDLLNKSNENQEINTILYITGKEAVIENGNWYMIYKDKKIEVEGIG